MHDTAHLVDGPCAVTAIAAAHQAVVVRLTPAPPIMRWRLPAGHTLVGLCGAAGSGKSTAGDILVDRHGFTSWAFAEPLRDMLSAAFEPAGIDHRWLTEPGLKEQRIPDMGPSGRELMQRFGTCGRDIDPCFWVRLTSMALGLNDLPDSAPVHDRIVITDVRYPEEAAWIQALGGHVVLVDRPQAVPVRAHESEAHYRRLGHTAVIDNSGGLEQLHAQVSQALLHIDMLDDLPLMP